MKKYFCLFVLLLSMMCIYSQVKLPINVGATLGSNMNSREGWAFSFGIHGDYKIMDSLLAGIQLNMSQDFYEIFAIEPSVYAKYFLPFSFFGFVPFAQLDLGCSVLNLDTSYPYFLAGITGGCQYKIGKIYLEPRASFGYPYFFAFNLACGYSF